MASSRIFGRRFRRRTSSGHGKKSSIASLAACGAIGAPEWASASRLRRHEVRNDAAAAIQNRFRVRAEVRDSNAKNDAASVIGRGYRAKAERRHEAAQRALEARERAMRLAQPARKAVGPCVVVSVSQGIFLHPS